MSTATDTRTETAFSALVKDVVKPVFRIVGPDEDLDALKAKHRSTYLEHVANYHGTSSGTYLQAAEGAKKWYA